MEKAPTATKDISGSIDGFDLCENGAKGRRKFAINSMRQCTANRIFSGRCRLALFNPLVVVFDFTQRLDREQSPEVLRFGDREGTEGSFLGWHGCFFVGGFQKREKLVRQKMPEQPVRNSPTANALNSVATPLISVGLEKLVFVACPQCGTPPGCLVLLT